jgi:DNA-binding transcriptional LysR family regulator
MTVNLKQIEAFVRVADLGSFRLAADRLNTTQPNISTRIANLEASIDTRLMERDAGSVRLTARGRELVDEARLILRATENFVAAAGRKYLSESTIKLGVTEMIVNTWLPEFFRAVKDHYPNLKIELTVDMSVNLKPALHSRSIDMAFQNGPFNRQMSGSQKLGRFPYVWVGAPTLKITRARKPGLDAMLAQPILSHGRETDQYQQIEAHFNKAGSKGAPNPNIVVSSNMAPCIYMAIQGMGISALPAAMARPYIAEGSLRQIKYEWVPKPLEFLARYDAQTASAVVADLAVLAHETAKGYPKQLD